MLGKPSATPVAEVLLGKLAVCGTTAAAIPLVVSKTLMALPVD
ncbi:hypothetical protein NK8_83530 (plasmid) [Caballeronia sp. NK8]|nr:hypothetical protein NK8_83530 [Caballeronia sp. NK8]